MVPRSAPGGPPEAFRLGYRPWLDGLRGWAILLVLACHLGFLPGGTLGVDLFFVLSGFLITCILVEEWRRTGDVNLTRFYLRRALRLWPAFFTLLLLYGLSNWLWRPAETKAALQHILVAACYASNWTKLHGWEAGGLGHTWSLSVEEQFYLLWPALLVLLLRRGSSPRSLLGITLVGIVTCAWWRAYLLRRCIAGGKYTAGDLAWRLYMGLDTRADALLVGCVVGLVAASGFLPRSRLALKALTTAAAAATVGLGGLTLFTWEMSPPYFRGLMTGVAVLAAVIIARLLAAPSRMGAMLLENAAVVGIGRISYGLYLFHVFVIYWVNPAMDMSWRRPGPTALVAALSCAAALTSYYVVERPFLRLKDRFGRPTFAPASAPLALRRAA